MPSYWLSPVVSVLNRPDVLHGLTGCQVGCSRSSAPDGIRNVIPVTNRDGGVWERSQMQKE